MPEPFRLNCTMCSTVDYRSRLETESFVIISDCLAVIGLPFGGHDL